MRPGWLLVAVLVGCAAPVRREARETPVEAGLDVPFTAPDARRWDFGDGTPPVEGQEVRHAFARPGRFVVRGFIGETLRDELTIIVRSRSALHLVPSDARYALVARSLEELGPAVDFGERLGGPDAVTRWFEDLPLLSWAFEQSSGASGPIDPREGVATWSWPDAPDARLSVVGVLDEPGALAALREWLPSRGWTFVSQVQGLWRYERESRALDVFADRGAVYAIDAELTERLPNAQARIAGGSALGLEFEPEVGGALDRLPSGGLVVMGRSPEALSWRFATAALRLTDGEAHLDGRLHGSKPLWTAPRPAVSRLLTRAPEGPIAVASASLPPAELASLVLGTPGAPRRRELESDLAAQGLSLDRVVGAFAGAFELAVYADVPGFVRGTIRNMGRPDPAGTVLFESPVLEAAPLESVIDALGRKWNLNLTRVDEKALRLWRGRTLGRPVELALTDVTLFARAGNPIAEREPVDLAGDYAKRFEGAFSTGHVSLFFDLGQLRRELLQPRLLDDVDPRKALTAQALAVTLLDRFTQLDWALFDLAPAPEGASVQIVLKLRPREAAR